MHEEGAFSFGQLRFGYMLDFRSTSNIETLTLILTLTLGDTGKYFNSKNI